MAADTGDQRQLPDADVVLRFYSNCYFWGQQLENQKSFAEVARICQEICNVVAKNNAITWQETINLKDLQLTPMATINPDTIPNSTAMELPTTIVTRKLLVLLLDETKPHSQRKIIVKSYYNLCCRNLLDGATLNTVWGVHDLKSPENNSLALYGMLHSRFLRMLETVPALSCVPKSNLFLFLSRSTGYTRWFNTVSENILTIERHGAFRDIFTDVWQQQMWHVVLINLESPYHGARENMLALIKLLIRDHTFTHNVVLPEVGRWSWMNRNKFYLLAVLLGQYPWETVRGQLQLTQDLLGEALIISLRYKHLYTGGQMLVRLLHSDQQMSEFVYKLAIRVFLRQELSDVQTMVKYWFSFFTPKASRLLYQLLNLEHIVLCYVQHSSADYQLPTYLSDNQHEKLFLMVHFFRHQLETHTTLQPFLIKLCVLVQTLKPLPPATLGLLIDTLGHYLIACGAKGKIDTLQHTVQLTRYVQEAMESPGHIVACQTAVSVCQKLLKHIIDTQQRHIPFDRDAQAHFAKFMSYDMYDKYLLPAGSKPLDYQPTITAFRLFAAFVEQFFEFPPTSKFVLQMRPSNTVGWVTQLLPDSLSMAELGSSFRSMVYGLQYLLRSEYDDVRSYALKMLYNRPTAHHFDPKLQGQLAMVHSSHGIQESIVRAMVRDLLSVTLTKLRTALEKHRHDFYAAVLTEEENPNDQLHRLIDQCTEFLNELCEFILEIHNSSRRRDRGTIGTSFKLLDRCQAVLLNQSEEWRKIKRPNSSQLALAKRKIQVALWKTLRAVAVFFEKHAIWLADQKLKATNCDDQLSLFRLEIHSLTHIMVSCCHRGAIEATGYSLSRVVRHAVQLKEEAPTILEAVKHVYSKWDDYMPLDPDDFRENRGLICMRHCFLRHDTNDLRDGTLLRDLLDDKLNLSECAKYHEQGGQKITVEVLWLHQLNLIARETSLNESILPHLDDLMVVALSHIRVPVWCVRNAALQLYASCSLKLTGQSQHYNDPSADWPPAYTSFEEVACKATRTILYMTSQLELMLQPPNHNGRTQTHDWPRRPFQLLVLQFLSKLEYRAYQTHHPGELSSTPHLEIVTKLRAIMWQMLGQEHDLIRKLAARCFAQLQDIYDEIPDLLNSLVFEMFTTQGDINFRHGLCQAVLACVQRYVTLSRHLELRGTIQSKEAILGHVREMVLSSYHYEVNLRPAAPFRYRSEQLKLLLYLGFERASPPITKLVLKRRAPNAFGRDVLIMQLNQLFNGNACTVSATGVVSIDPDTVDTNVEHKQPQACTTSYEIILEWDHDLDLLAVDEDVN
uniref:DUF2428 domain-containing protein n=1 Tax=Anopheles epiroticus TaxID=199890 RepID=A0A182PU05_9DIPT